MALGKTRSERGVITQRLRGMDHNAMALVAAVLPSSQGDQAGGWLMAAPDLSL